MVIKEEKKKSENVSHNFFKEESVALQEQDQHIIHLEEEINVNDVSSLKKKGIKKTKVNRGIRTVVLVIPRIIKYQAQQS